MELQPVADTGAGLKWFVRSTAVFVGLANLFVLGWSDEVGYAIRQGLLTWVDIAPIALVAVVTALAIAQLFLTGFGPSVFVGKFYVRCGYVVLVLCLGGALTGGLVAYALTLGSALTVTTGLMLQALVPAAVGAGFGLVLGLAEAVILAPILATALGVFEGRGRRAGPSS